MDHACHSSHHAAGVDVAVMQALPLVVAVGVNVAAQAWLRHCPGHVPGVQVQLLVSRWAGCLGTGPLVVVSLSWLECCKQH